METGWLQSLQGCLLSRAYCEGQRRFLSSAPWTFTTIIFPVVAMCGENGIRLMAYLDDDFLVLARNWRPLISHTSIVDILDQAGFQRNLKKYHLQPRQKFQYLCLQWEGIASDASGGQGYKILLD